MKQYKLKDCPFCGKQPRINSEFYDELMKENGTARLEIKCKCGAELAIYSFQYPEEEQRLDTMTDRLVEKWNDRPIEREVEEVNAMLVQKISETESSLKSVSEEAHEYLGKWTQALKRNEILSRVIVMSEVSRACPDLAAEYRQEAHK